MLEQATLAEFEDSPQYDTGKFPTLRPFQEAAHHALRAGAKAGHRVQMVMAPTGSGKTILGLNIIAQALQKGRKAVFVCDRTTLIDQTSAVSDQYGLSAHGILQANHWRTNSAMPFQIASAQTLARRQWPDADVIVIDEAHTQLKAWTDHVPNCRANVIGLSATPFSKGLGKIFTNLVNATTMHELTVSGVLVPMRVLSCTQINMAGAATAFDGEWADSAVEQRGSAILGDVVTEWVKFGENRKTIVFGATIKHCEDLAQQFIDCGIMAAVFTSHTTPVERAQLLKEYRKTDSSLKVLISVEALAKGFDVPDVGCVVDCRPLRKSLSTAIQMWGRGLRSSPGTGKTDCLARDTLVLTDKGEVKIQDITLDHLVWDGHNFVCHAGAVCKGIQRVIEYDGLIATPDHEVMTNDGWKRIEEAACKQLRITRAGFGGVPLRLTNDCLNKNTEQWVQSSSGSAMRSMPRSSHGVVPQHSQAAKYSGLSSLQWPSSSECPAMALHAMPSSNATMLQSAGVFLRALRRAWNRIPFFLGKRGRNMGCEQHWGSKESTDATGPDRQQRPLRTGESSLVNSGVKHEQHQSIRQQSSVHAIQEILSAREVRRRDTLSDDCSRIDIRGNQRAVAGAVIQAEREVWDVLNAGPLQRFTANGRLVHNCILLDHSGNIIRFLEDYTDVFFNGLSELDMGEKLDKVIRKESEEKEKSGCPSCGFKPFAKRCMSCGFEIKTMSDVQHEAGQMRAVNMPVMAGKKQLAENHQHLWGQVCTYARSHSAPDKQAGRAAHLFRDMVGDWPPRGWNINSTPDTIITREVLNKIKAKSIAFSFARKKAA